MIDYSYGNMAGKVFPYHSIGLCVCIRLVIGGSSNYNHNF